MTSESLIEQLLDKWEEQRNAGLTADLTEICRDHPQLFQTVTERVRAFEAMDKALRHSDHTASKISDGQSTPGTTVNSSSPEIMVARAQYRILRSHARGGLGEVLLAQDERLLRQVAIKRIQPHHAGESGRQQRFLREATITGQLDHPGIVSILNVCEDEAGNPCYAMKFVDGQSLDQFARQLHEPFTARLRRDSRSRQLFESHVIRPLLARFVSVCNTIAFAHTRGVIHRDIKPANVMLGDFGATYVVDWGLAKTDAAKTKPTGFEPLIAAENQQTITVADSVTADGAAELLRESLTQTGAVMGTPAFMSPEQASSDTSQVGPLSDIYSLGATLYFLLTGSPPIVSGTDMNWFEQLRTGSFPPPKRVQPFVPTALESVCLKAMSLKPDERYLSPLELARDIDRWLADEPVFAHSDGWSTRIARFTRQHRALTQVGGFALIVITVLSTVLAIVMDDRRRSVEAEVSTSRNLASLRERTAIEMTALAEKESAARRIADEQNNLALSTLRSVIFRIARNLKSVEGAAAIRTQLLTTAIDGLGKVAATLDTRIEVDRNLIVAHNDIGKIYMAAGSLEKVNTTAEALRHFQKAAAIGNTLLNSTPADDMLQRDISVTMELAGDACIQLGDLAAADIAYAESLAISERRLRLKPADLKRRQDTGFGYEKVGDVLFTRGNLVEAQRHFRRSLEIYQQIVADKPSEASYQRDLLVARSKLGNIERLEGKLRDAAKTFRECVATCEALEKIPESGAQRRDRAVMLNKLGSVLIEQTMFPEAANAFSTALQIARDAVTAEPGSTTARRDLSISLKYIGETNRYRDDAESSTKLYEESLAIRRTLAAEDASSQVAQADVAVILVELGDLELAAGQSETAGLHLTEAASILNTLKDSGKLEGAEEKKLLERIMELQSK